MTYAPRSRISARSRAFSSARRTTTVYWPIAVDVRLDRLVDEVAAHGVTVSRSELVAALVATTEIDGAAILDRYRSYRTLDVRTLTGIEGDYLRPRVKRPGRRPTAGE